jgi:endonuclease YncB( thermonuclease family)
MKTILRIYYTEAKANDAMRRALEAGWSVDWMRPEPNGIHVSFSREETTFAVGRTRLSRPALITLGVAIPLCLCALAVGIVGLSQQGEPTPAPIAAIVPSPTAPPTIPPASPPAPAPTTTSPPAPPPRTAGTLPSPSGYATATASFVLARVTHVTDGDTIDVVIDSRTDTVRYIGIDTPEHGFPYYQEALEANRALVQGQEVRLEYDISSRDRYDRLLAYVYLSSGVFVNGQLVSQGLAESVTYAPDTKHQAELDALEELAKSQQVGMWTLAAPTPLVIDASCSQFNSPGDDDFSLDQEYVCITNEGTGTVDMTRWWIRDKAGATFYFPPFTLAAGADVRVRTGCGQNTATDLYWCKSDSAVWNNSGDSAYLYNAQDQLVHDLTY